MSYYDENGNALSLSPTQNAANMMGVRMIWDSSMNNGKGGSAGTYYSSPEEATASKARLSQPANQALVVGAQSQPSMPAATPPVNNQPASSPLPSGFNWQNYLAANKDLGVAGLKTQQQAEEHYQKYGKSEGRSILAPTSTSAVDDWATGRAFESSAIPKGFDWTQYLSLNPLLSEAGLDTETEAQRHYALYGAAEGRKYAVDNPVGTVPPYNDPSQQRESYIPMGGSNGYQRSARENLSAMLQSGRSAIATRSQAPISARQVVQGGAFNPGVRSVAAPVYKAPDPVTPISVSSDYLTSAINKILSPEVVAPPAAAPAPTPTPIINDYGGGA